ncbi:MAG: type II toxin-antitoxin system VapC family toxin [Mycobacteriales bacterium]|nr:type II toxin-antitoxin system VapC family toxin [Mycobacteriales bacterium]
MILVDTSVWIDHLRATESTLVDALARDEVACHPLVIQELALGSLKNRDAVLASLGRLTQSPSLNHDELLTLVSAHVLWGKGLSPVDAHLLGSVLLSPGTRLWTRDKSLKASAGSLGASTVDWH